jgi:hypothetical protein
MNPRSTSQPTEGRRRFALIVSPLYGFDAQGRQMTARGSAG